MKKIVTIILICFSFFVKADNWVQIADLSGGGRALPVGFSIGATGYVGLGHTGIPLSFLNDFWEYDPSSGAWSQKANFSGPVGVGAVGFSVASKGYVGTGWGIPNIPELWEYDPVLNSWTQKANFSLPVQSGGVFFSFGSKAYVGLGRDSINQPTNDFWEYDLATDLWIQKASYPDTSFWAWNGPVFGFGIGTKGYIGTVTSMGTGTFWEYDPSADLWTQKANLINSGGVGFSIGTKGYAGYPSTAAVGFAEYDPSTNVWTNKAIIPPASNPYLYLSIGFSIGSKGYFGAGWSGTISYLPWFWEYTPDSSATGIPESTQNNFSIEIFPNPCSQFVVCNIQSMHASNITLTIKDIVGKEVLHTQLQASNKKFQTEIDVSNFANGVYFLQADDGKEKLVKKFVKE